jgi:hypothetical protein
VYDIELIGHLNVNLLYIYIYKVSVQRSNAATESVCYTNNSSSSGGDSSNNHHNHNNPSLARNT